MSIKTTDTVVHLLEQLREAEGPVGVTELAGDLDRAKSTVHSHLQSLERHGFVVHAERGYRLGLRFLDFGIIARDGLPFYQVARPKSDQLASRVGQRVWMLTEEGGRGVRIYVSEVDHKIQTDAYLGQRTYLHQSAAGKAILAFLPESRVHEIVDRHGLPAATERTITDREALFEELATIRETGLAYNRGESVWGLRAVGAPVRDRDGSVVGSLSIAAAAHLLKDDLLGSDISEQLLGTVNEIEINLTHS